ncbi:hypothetical protein [Streptomyces sp. H34-S4]|uniref:hypothetical protein n=1 Tax=Streptomyces sp. H34-S4 TaxID=2996463 RepID=UPI00226F5A1D|nr:hypothetical protein [Streptomyces sp. H34-S4]MCY0933857.1 hypothetical protein [Streptomyces sp. H34-S4]
MNAADHIAAELSRQTRQHVDFDVLAGAADRIDSSLPTSPRRRQVLSDAAQHLAQRGLLRLPIGRSGWDHSTLPALPLWVRRAAAPRAQRPATTPRAYVPQLGFAAIMALTTREEALLSPVNTLLRDQPDAEIIPLAERSYELFGDEKHLSHHIRIEQHRLVTSGLLGLAAHLRAEPSPAPLAMYELGPAPWLLIVENSAAFTSLRKILNTWPDRDQVGWLGYGSGDQLIASLPTAVDAFHERDHPVDCLMLYADLDLDGLLCAQQACARATSAGLPALIPAAALYQHLLDQKPRQLSPAPEEAARAATSWLPAHLAHRVEEHLRAGMVFRQEALMRPRLRALLDPSAPLLPQLRDSSPRSAAAAIDPDQRDSSPYLDPMDS